MSEGRRRRVSGPASGRGPLGRALLEHHRDGADEPLRLHSDLGEVDELPVDFFFRDEDELGELERIALEEARGRILDVGAGAGVHALALQERGHEVTAIDVVPAAVEVMEARGVEDARRADVFQFDDARYDTVLMLLNGIGMVGTLSGLERFLTSAPRLLAGGGQLLLDSADLRPRVGGDRREDGRYAGEVHLQLEYRGERGAPYPQLYVDPETLASRAEERGWRVEVLARAEAGEYLARLTRNGV